MKKRIISLATALIICASMNVIAFAETAQQPTSISQENTERITPKADVIVNKYRNYNGRLQVRKWNETKGWWIGEWEYIV